VPFNFRRLIGGRLKTMVEEGMLIKVSVAKGTYIFKPAAMKGQLVSLKARLSHISPIVPDSLMQYYLGTAL
jgi:hypothetical protein